MVRRKSNQRITKIKRDFLEELIKKAEGTNINDAVIIHPAGDDLTPYPDMNYLRTWIRDYLLKGLTKTFVTDMQESGKTTMTTIVDGLVLNTSMTKSINVSGEPTQVEIPWTQPIMTTDGSLGGSEYGIAFSSEYTSDASVAYGPARNAFSDFSDTSKCWSPYGTPPEWITFYSPNKLKVTSVDFNFNAGGFREAMPACNAYGSNDNSTWTPIGSFSGNTSFTITLTTNSSEFYYYHKYEFPQQALSNKGKVKILQHGVTLETITGVTTAELPKPGLLLSNLSEPVSHSFSGGWLRQNLIHEDYSNINDITSSTLGHFAFSYLQQGIFHRDAGSTHEDFDSFNLHWSPSALGCMSHEAIVIPNNLLQNVYSTYQSMVVPIDADMQTYNFGATKDVQFTFVDNNNDIPLTTTTYNGRVVGKDWSYEFKVRPNFSGSGTNYEGQTRCCPDDDATCISNLNCSGADATCPECVSDDTRSNGICIQGIITTNDECSQEINECFETTQAVWNEANTSKDNAKDLGNLISDSSRKVNIIGAGSSGTISNTCYGSLSFSRHPISINPGESFKIMNVSKSCSSLSGSLSYRLKYWDVDTQSYITQNYNGLSGTVQDIAKDLEEVSLVSTSTDCYNEWVGCGGGAVLNTTNAYVDIVNTTEVQQPQNNVNLYLHIKDLKAEAESLGLPWAEDCSVDRFEVSVTTEQSTDRFTTSKLVYENLNVSELGDISGLGLDTLTVKG